MAWSSPSSDSRIAQKAIEIKETRRRLLEQRLNWKIQEIKNHPYVKKILVTIVHEDLTLERMYAHRLDIIRYSKEIDSVEDSLEESHNSKRKKKRLSSSLKSRLSNSIKLFWKNQNKFLEFIDLENPGRISDKANTGYVDYYSWALSGEKSFRDGKGYVFLGKYEKYQERFRDMNNIELEAERRKNWEIYNNLCIVMHEIAPKHDSIDSILIPDVE